MLGRSVRSQRISRRTAFSLVGIILSLLVVISVLIATSNDAPATPAAPAAPKGSAEVTFPHMHGMGFSADGRQLVMAAHDSIRTYVDGAWTRPDVPAHDYMGYTPTNNGFYSSEHPAPESNLVNPLGLIKSTDGGKTFSTLRFNGETDFHTPTCWMIVQPESS